QAPDPRCPAGPVDLPDVGDLVLAQSDPPAETGVMTVLVLAAAAVRDAQDDQFGVPAGQSSAGHHRGAVDQPGAEQAAPPPQGREDMGPSAADHPTSQLGDGGVEQADLAASSGCDP